MEAMRPILEKLLAVRQKPLGTPARLTRPEIRFLCTSARQLFAAQPSLLEIAAPVTIVGDIHGQYHDLLRVFEIAKYPPETVYLFLGDYVDRGLASIETVCLLFVFKIRYPVNFFMLRGNHECQYLNRLYGFYDECIRHYDSGVWNMFCDVFTYLPFAALIDEKIFCVHGGISPGLTSLDLIRHVQRPCEIPQEGWLCDLVWADPSPDAIDWDDNPRGVSYSFSSDKADDFLKKFDLDLICRAHQAVMEGFEFPFQRQNLVTIFSAPNYCCEFHNKGAILKVDSNLFCQFLVLEPVDWDREADTEVIQRPGTPPRVTPDTCQPSGFSARA
jgi:serine/threonine-protein phosphatase PP1 catalytic subunit